MKDRKEELAKAEHALNVAVATYEIRPNEDNSGVVYVAMRNYQTAWVNAAPVDIPEAAE